MKPNEPPLPAPQPLHFVRRGAVVSLDNVPPSRTLLQVLREDLGQCGTKEGCGEGDCGACTVVLAEPDGAGLRYSAINSCIRLAHSVQGMALWTVEDLAADPLIDRQGAPLHPAQQAMLDCHGSQCGFCTPGFVMSLFGTYQNRVLQGQTVDRAVAQADLSGNLCRCTGYRPILDAAQQMAQLPQRRSTKRRCANCWPSCPPGLCRQPAKPAAPDPCPAERICLPRLPGARHARSLAAGPRPPPRGPIGGRLHRCGAVDHQRPPAVQPGAGRDTRRRTATGGALPAPSWPSAPA
jgi:aerobic-type carbon monoxide dehydrogenase small subunit (CoxS/CutS family)